MNSEYVFQKRHQMSFFLPMIPPKATAQEKQINWKTHQLYLSPAAKDARAKLRAHLANHVPPAPISNSIAMEIGWSFPISGNHKDIEPYAQKPDLDNLNKALLDVMQELQFFNDDKQVALLTTYKQYSEDPGIFIQIFTFEEVNKYESDSEVPE